MKNNKQSMFLVLLLGSIVFLAACTSSSDKKEVEFVVPVFPPPPETPRFTYIDTIRSSADVLKEDSTSAFRRFATGEQRIGQGFSKPYSVIVQDGRIYVGDTVRHTVMVMDPEGEGKFFEIGKTEPGKLTSPMGMAKDAKGNIYVNDAKAKKVVVYDRDGNFITTFGGKDYFQRLSGIAVDPDGKRAFVVDTGGVQSQEHRIRVFDVASGKHEYDIGTRGTADGQFNLPVSAVINKFNGLLYVVDSGNFRVQVFNQDGTFVNKFGDVGRRTGQFSRPKGISSDKQGNIYVVDTAFGNVQIFTSKGELLMFLGGRGGVDKPAKYMLPSGVDVDDNGQVYIIDQFYRKLEVYKPVESMSPEDANDVKP